MRARVDTVWQPKAGNTSGEYEDAYFSARSGMRVSYTLRFAVADGATESSFSGVWARQLVAAYGGGHLTLPEWNESVATLRGAWIQAVSGRPLPWYAEEKLRAGAHSSLLGLTVHSDSQTSKRVWSAEAVGDSCLVLVRNDELVRSFPIASAEEFGSTPYLLASRARRDGAPDCFPQMCHGEAERGDTFYLLTDALAQWFLRLHEAGEKPWQVLTPYISPRRRRQFGTWLAELRMSSGIRNDDVTMVRVEME